MVKFKMCFFLFFLFVGVSIFENFPPSDFPVSLEHLCPKQIGSNLPIFRSLFLSGIGSKCGTVFPALRADFFDGANSSPDNITSRAFLRLPV